MLPPGSKRDNMKDEVLTTSRPMTVGEYIAFEESADVRHEFINGNLIPMPGITLDHNTICMNIVQALRALLKQHALSGYRVFQENVKVQITSERDYTYPDVMLTQDERDVESDYIIKYPTVIFEVLSKSSRIEDSTDKFIRYKQIESLRDYILVDSEKMIVEVRTKTESGAWEATSYLQSDGLFPVPSVGLDLAFDEVYDGVRALT